MKEIQVNGNDTGLKVFINDVPDLSQIPKDITDTLITTLEHQISEHLEQVKKRTANTDI